MRSIRMNRGSIPGLEENQSNLQRYTAIPDRASKKCHQTSFLARRSDPCERVDHWRHLAVGREQVGSGLQRWRC